MTDKQIELDQLLAKLESERPIINEIMSRKSTIETGRKPKMLCAIPNDADFFLKDGNTEYEVVGHFNPDSKEFLLDTIIRKLGYEFYDEN